MELKDRIKYIFFDADDTLWENERYFRAAEEKFAALLSEYTSPEGLQQTLWQKQEDNIPLYGYGSKTYMIGMADAAMELCGGSLPEHIYYGIKDIIKNLAFHELEIIDGVVETLEALQGRYTLIVATKGDLPEQMNKYRMSGLEKYFQIAPCFRDEDPRADRAPGEFYQLDFEMSFATQEDVFAVMESVLPKIFEKYGKNREEYRSITEEECREFITNCEKINCYVSMREILGFVEELVGKNNFSYLPYPSEY